MSRPAPFPAFPCISHSSPTRSLNLERFCDALAARPHKDSAKDAKTLFPPTAGERRRRRRRRRRKRERENREQHLRKSEKLLQDPDAAETDTREFRAPRPGRCVLSQPRFQPQSTDST